MTVADRPVRTGWILAAVSTALFCVQVDFFAMNLALPRMAEELGTSATDLQWVVSVYMLALGAFLVPAGRIGDIFGRRLSLMVGLGLFGVASVLCALAPSAGFVIAFRVVQGLGAALIFPVSISVLTNAFPAARAAGAIGMAYGIAGIGNAAGPVVGGFLTETVGWRFVFWVNVPLVLIAIVIGMATIGESRDPDAPRRIDLAGLALLMLGIGLFTITFDRASSWGWWSGATLGALVGSLVALIVFVMVERRVAVPLVDLSLARNATFVVLVIAGTIANIAYGVTIFASTLYLQDVRGLDPLMAGLVFLGPSAGAALGGPLSGRLAARYPAILVLGLTSVVAAVALATLACAGGWVLYVIALSACGLTLGLVYAFTTVATQAVVRPERAGEAAGVTLTSLITLGGVGVAVAGTALEVLQRRGWSEGAAIDAVLATCAALLLPAALCVVLIGWRRRDAQQSV